MNLIGLTGPATCGKNTVAKMIDDWGAKADVPVAELAFAVALKKSVARLFIPDATAEEGVTFSDRIKRPGYRVEIYSDQEIVATCSGRELLQRYGTESHRGVFGANFWVDHLMEKVDGLMATSALTVITDVRFENEARAIVDRGGEVWRIDREVAAIESHQSEAGIPFYLVTRVIDNTGSLDSLRNQVEAVMTVIHLTLPMLEKAAL